MTGLVDAVRALVAYDRRSPALLVQRPDGRYHVSPNGYGDGLANVYIISRAQISDLMHTADITRATLSDAAVADQLANLVSTFHQQRIGARS